MLSTCDLLEFVEVLECIEDGLHICYRDLDEDDLAMIRIGLEKGEKPHIIALSVVSDRESPDWGE